MSLCLYWMCGGVRPPAAEASAMMCSRSADTDAGGVVEAAAYARLI
jgi:hypothetical protein